MKIFRLASGIKLKGYTGPGGSLALDVLKPDGWYPLTATDLIAQATHALALAAIGSPPEGFTFTQDDRYVEPVSPTDANFAKYNPFTLRASLRR